MGENFNRKGLETRLIRAVAELDYKPKTTVKLSTLLRAANRVKRSSELINVIYEYLEDLGLSVSPSITEIHSSDLDATLTLRRS